MHAQTVNFRASTDKKVVAKNEELKITFLLNSNGREFRAPDFPSELKLISGPEVFSKQVLRNHSLEVQESYTYRFIAKEEGQIVIPPASIVVRARTYTTQPLEIQISGEIDRSKDPNDPYNIVSKNVFLRTELSKTNVYLGEEITATYKLYFNMNINGLEYESVPSHDGFYQRYIDIEKQIRTRENYKGQTYEVVVLKQVVLIPQKTGELKLDPMELNLSVPVPTKQVDFFGRRVTRDYTYSAVSQAPTIKVNALPLEGRPKSFNGAVGQYTFSSSLNKTEVEANQSVSVKLNLKGQGNLPLFDLPELEMPPTIEAYDPKYNESISVSAAGLRGTKSNEYLLIPRYGGEYKIAPIQFTYFDPSAEEYKTITTEDYTIKVTGGEPLPTGAQASVATPGKEEVELLDKDIHFVKTGNPNLVKINTGFFNTTKFYSLLVAPFLLFIVFIGVQKQMQVRNADKSAVKNRNAARLAKKHLSEAKKQLNANNREAFYEALAKGLWGYLSDKLNIEKAKLNKDTTKDTLQKRGVEVSLSDDVLALIDRCEFARFAPDNSATQQEGEYEKAVSLIGKLEKQL